MNFEQFLMLLEELENIMDNETPVSPGDIELTTMESGSAPTRERRRSSIDIAALDNSGRKKLEQYYEDHKLKSLGRKKKKLNPRSGCKALKTKMEETTAQAFFGVLLFVTFLRTSQLLSGLLGSRGWVRYNPSRDQTRRYDD